MSWIDVLPWLIVTASTIVGAALLLLGFILWMMCRVASGEFE